jgi:SAM-dependent methyltransferase
MDIRNYNRQAWNKQVEKENMWTVPVTPDEIEAARQGEWEIIVTPDKAVPRSWYPNPFAGCDLLGLACGGGQQGPIFAAAGANVTILDFSPNQLGQDRMVAEREELSIQTVEGDMADLNMFDDESFDVVVNPVSTPFVPDVRPVWREAYRVLRPGGILITGFCNPAIYIFDLAASEDHGRLEVKYTLPFSDVEQLTEAERQRFIDRDEPLEHSHTLNDLIGGQLDAGFVLTDMFEDNWYEDGKQKIPLARHMPMFLATRALKLA